MNSIVMIGLGGLGGKTVEAAAAALPDGCGADFVAVDADRAALAALTRPRKIEIGAARFDGLGFNGDRIGAALALSDSAAEHAHEIFGAARIAVVVAGLGKGSAGALPKMLALAADRNIATLCLMAKPFRFEGLDVERTAEEALKSVAGARGCLAVVENEELAKAPPGSGGGDGVAESFRRASAALCEWLSLFWKMTALGGYLNIGAGTLADTLRRGAGACHPGFASAAGHGRAGAAMRAILDAGGAARAASAKGALAGIIGGGDLLLREVAEVMGALTASLPHEARVRMGTVLDPAAEGELRVATLFFDEWREHALPDEDGAAPAPEAAENGSRRQAANPRGRKTLKRKNTAAAKKFDGTAPAIHDGEDLDKPTFIRRQLNIDLS